MSQGGIDWIIVGSDRIAANGDVANKIGTYSLAVNARYHGVKFMVVAPSTTVDMDTVDGAAIPIETRDAAEVLSLAGQSMAAEGAGAWNPVFDVTPAELIDELIRMLAEAMQRPCRLWPFPPSVLAIFSKLLGQYGVWARLAGSLQIDISKARQQLGWEPAIPLEQGLAKTADWYQKTHLANK